MPRLAAPAISLSSRLMEPGGYTTPFVIAAYLASSLIYWLGLRRLELQVGREGAAQAQVQPMPASAPATWS